MSAVKTLSQAGAGVKNLAIGIAVIGGVIALVYLFRKSSEAAAAVVDTIKDATGYVSGSSQDRTLGTDLYDWLNPPQPYQSPEQAQKTRDAIRLGRAREAARVDLYG